MSKIFKVSFLASEDAVGKALGLLDGIVNSFTYHGVGAAEGKVRTEATTTTRKIRILTRQRGNKDPAQTDTGRAVLKVLHELPIARYPDFEVEFNQRGWASSSVSGTLAALVKSGAVVRCGWGAYQLPNRASRASERRPVEGSQQGSSVHTSNGV